MMLEKTYSVEYQGALLDTNLIIYINSVTGKFIINLAF